MKKLAILLVTSLFAFSVANAQIQSPKAEKAENGNAVKSEYLPPFKNISASAVSEITRNNLAIDFPNATNVSWEKTSQFDQANFIDNGQDKIAYYDPEGTLVGTTTAVAFTELPLRAQKEIKHRYRKYTIGPVIFFKDNASNDEDMVLWATQFDDQDMYFAELDKGSDKMILKVSPSGGVTFFKELE
jgi:hypothetical protein